MRGEGAHSEASRGLASCNHHSVGWRPAANERLYNRQVVRSVISSVVVCSTESLIPPSSPIAAPRRTPLFPARVSPLRLKHARANNATNLERYAPLHGKHLRAATDYPLFSIRRSLFIISLTAPDRLDTLVDLPAPPAIL